MGVDYSPPARVLTPEEQKAAGKKHAEQEAKTVKWLYSQATNGSASAQCSLGKRYLIGQGVETNEALAIEWFNKAAAQGDMEASNKLARLSASTSDSLVNTTNSQK
jgi:TPR repeat protein